LRVACIKPYYSYRYIVYYSIAAPGQPIAPAPEREFGYNRNPPREKRGRRRQTIRELATTGICFVCLCLLLYLERRNLRREARRIPLRVAVTGTRGKSAVTRMIAAALKEAGISVLAKTTGSKPVLIFPDGREEEIARRGRPTVLEQKRLIRKAAGLGVRAIVTEMMSIQPECLAVESGHLLQPQYLVVTNARLDHREEMGRTRPEIARSLSCAIRPGTTVFVLESERRPEFVAAARRAGAKLITVEDTESNSVFDKNILLAEAAASYLGVSGAAARQGISAAAPDFGSLKAWEAELGLPPAAWTLVSAFAANEPESSSLLIGYLQNRLALIGRPLVGILNFRADRGDRTRQWLDAHRQGFFSGFRSVYVVGAHVHSLVIRRRTGPPVLIPLPDRTPEAIMNKIASLEGAAPVLIGLGNIGGTGTALVEHWEKIGRPHAL
jgi:poly-gamma-glutamate synthase PgsB/CapB